MIAATVLLFLVAGSAAYCALVLLAAGRYLAERKRDAGQAAPGISVLKPLAGAEPDLEENLRSFFRQDYVTFELIFAARQADDAGLVVARRLADEYPHVSACFLITGEPTYPNAKVFSLARMAETARYDLLVMSDSDIRAEADFLRRIAAEFADPELAVVSCPYRAVPGWSVWSRLEAAGMNTTFLAGVLAARLVEGVKFAIGPTVAARRTVLADIGGLDSLGDYLAEDFVLGQRAAAKGHKVELSGVAVVHSIGSQGLRENARHRLRWARSTRRSRPLGYVGSVFTHTLPLAVMLVAAHPPWWPVAAWAALLRTLSAWFVAGRVLHDPLCTRRWWLVPVEDVLSFLFWLAGFAGRTVTWRGRRYRLEADGRFRLDEGRPGERIRA